MKIRWSKASALWLGLVIAPMARAEPPLIVQQEVNYLLRYIGDSGCKFKRNGSWSDSKTAEAHVRRKYDFLVARSRVDSTQDFIDGAATESSLTGRPYEIRCGDAPSIPSSLWLRDELARYRTSQ